MNDNEILELENLNQKVFMVFEKYKPLIIKKAYIYCRCSKNRMCVEDFISDVYEILYYFVGRIEKSKVKNLENFSYYRSVQYAILRIYKKIRKLVKNEKLINIDDDNKPEFQFVAKEKVEDPLPDVNTFMKLLTVRQRRILNYKMEGKTLNEIRTKLKCSYGTVHRDIYLAKQTYLKKFDI